MVSCGSYRVEEGDRNEVVVELWRRRRERGEEKKRNSNKGE
jgi:hypothetical protein